MAEEYTREQFWKLYEKLPEELKEAIFSEETAENIWNIYERNDIEKISEVSKYVGRVLLGILSPDEFQKTLEEEIKIKKDKKVAREINRFIFYPVKSYLEKIYKIEITPSVKPKVVPLPKERAPGKDIYREPIE